jgi:hypothetical protein
MPAFNDTPNTQIPHNLLKQNNLPKARNTDTLEVRYGFSILKFNNGPSEEVKIDHQANSKDGSLFIWGKTAEASSLPGDLTIKDLEKICNAVNGAGRLDDLKDVLSQKNFQLLGEKVKAGSSQYVVLAMVQAMRPYNISIMDFNIGDDQGSLAVRGRSYFGPVGGLIRLVKEDGAWKIDNENWYAGGRDSIDYIAASVNPLTTKSKYTSVRSSSLMSQLSPDSRPNYNMLALSRAPYHKNGRSINFVFMLKKAKTQSDRSPDIYNRGSAGQVQGLPRAPMHVLWTGSKRLMPEQKVVDYQSPVDFSIANYDDGYAPGQWNFVMPTKKPREITVSMLLNF